MTKKEEKLQRKNEELQREKEELRRQLAEAEEALAAIHAGEVDAIVVDGATGEQIFSLTGAETVYRLAVETMAEATINVCPDGTIIFCNARFSEFVRTPIEHLLGRDIARFVPAEDQEAFRTLLRTCCEQPIRELVVFCDPDSGRRAVYLSGTALATGEDVSLCLVAADLSELESSAHQIELLRQHQHWLEQAQTELRKSEQRWATTLASIGDAVIATDKIGKITFMNAAAEELTGWTMAEVAEQPVGTAFHIINEVTRQAVEDPVSKVLETGLVVGLANHTLLVRKDGKEVPIDDSGAPIIDHLGKATGVVVVFHDISEKRRAEEELRRLNETLERRVDQRTAALKKSREQFRQLSNELLQAQENERKRIANEIHDNAG